MNSAGFYYAPCPYCGQSSEKRDGCGGCPACGGRYPGGAPEQETELSIVYDSYFCDGGVSMIGLGGKIPRGRRIR